VLAHDKTVTAELNSEDRIALRPAVSSVRGSEKWDHLIPWDSGRLDTRRSQEARMTLYFWMRELRITVASASHGTAARNCYSTYSLRSSTAVFPKTPHSHCCYSRNMRAIPWPSDLWSFAEKWSMHVCANKHAHPTTASIDSCCRETHYITR